MSEERDEQLIKLFFLLMFLIGVLVTLYNYIDLGAVFYKFISIGL
jgi:hypothetical protein